MHRMSIGSRLFDAFNLILLTGFALITVLPFIYVIAGSFTTTTELLKKGFVLIPTVYSLEAYHYIFSTPIIIRSLLNTIYITLLGTFLNLVFTSLMAYPLARKALFMRRGIMLMVIFSMLFSGGMIPSFLVVKELHLINTYWALMIPGLISAFNLIILKNFFQELPDGIEESAKIDGCNDLGILLRIVLPLSMPVIATLTLFYAVGHWNSFFSAIIYLNQSDKWPIQVILRQIVIMSEGGLFDSSGFGPEYVTPPSQSIKMAVIVVATAPILVVYPFLQKHFAKGVLLGSVKG